jgi:arsenate reductase (thioredoxin)
MKILVLCTGNSCRSQMAEGILKSYDKRLLVVSAGTEPSAEVHPMAVRVMNDIGIDISNNHPKSVDEFLSENFDYVVTVCGGANDNCPVFAGNVKNRIHIGFDDPAEASGSEQYIQSEFIRIRNEISNDFHEFYIEKLKPLL